MCHASLDYVEGMSLYEWVTKHKEIEKGKLYLWIKELAAQLSMFQKQRGSPVYKYLTPHNVIVTRKGRIMLAVSKEERDGVKPLDKYFEPPYPNQAADVYCLGKMIQFIMAHVRCEPYLSKKEAEFDKNHYEMGQSMSHDAGSWKILKYGRPITLEVQHG